MNKRILSLCVLAGVSLLSCADTNALYPDGAYTSGTFVEHVYDVWEGKRKAIKTSPRPKCCKTRNTAISVARVNMTT